jgi:hypothetical protein
MEKGTAVEQIFERRRRLHEAGVKVGFFPAVWLSRRDKGRYREDAADGARLPPDDIGMSVSYPLPGTPFHERVKPELGEQRNWQDSADLAMMYAGPFATPFYRQLHTVLHKEFRARKSLGGAAGARAIRPACARPPAPAAVVFHRGDTAPCRLGWKRLAHTTRGGERAAGRPFA